MKARYLVMATLFAALLAFTGGAVLAGAQRQGPAGWEPEQFSVPAEAGGPAVPVAPQEGPGVVITVTTTDPAANPGDGDCSLIEAINNANADADTSGGDCPPGAGPDTIQLAEAATYTLVAVDNTTDGDNGLPSIASEVAVQGNGSVIERSPAGDTPAFRLLHVSPGAALTLNDLTLQNGLTSAGEDGGAIRNQGGTLQLNGCVLRYNEAAGGDGGAIYSRAAGADAGVLLVNSEVMSNTAGISGGGLMTVAGSDLTATLTISSSLVSYNWAGESAGGIRSTRVAGSSNYGNFVSVLSSEVSHNVTTNSAVLVGGGGIINNYAELLIADSAVSHNRAETGSAFGGGVINNFGNAQILRSAVTNNLAGSSGGPVTAGGGGVVNSDGAMLIANSTLSGNSAFGGSNGGALLAANFFGSAASSVTVVNTTVSQNSADGEGGAAAGFDFAGGQPLTITFSNSIVSANPAGDLRNCTTGTIAAVISGDHNLEELDTCNFNMPNDMVNTDPLLGTLQNNGGPTDTHALSPGSPAVDSGNDIICGLWPVSGVDQRGVVRPLGISCDRGAYEAEQPTSVNLSGFDGPGAEATLGRAAIIVLALIAALAAGVRRRRGRRILP